MCIEVKKNIYRILPKQTKRKSNILIILIRIYTCIGITHKYIYICNTHGHIFNSFILQQIKKNYCWIGNKFYHYKFTIERFLFFFLLLLLLLFYSKEGANGTENSEVSNKTTTTFSYSVSWNITNKTKPKWKEREK